VWEFLNRAVAQLHHPKIHEGEDGDIDSGEGVVLEVGADLDSSSFSQGRSDKRVVVIRAEVGRAMPTNPVRRASPQ